jgi:hypothetical protein
MHALQSFRKPNDTGDPLLFPRGGPSELCRYLEAGSQTGVVGYHCHPMGKVRCYQALYTV